MTMSGQPVTRKDGSDKTLEDQIRLVMNVLTRKPY
jgi:hypothetical protein